MPPPSRPHDAMDMSGFVSTESLDDIMMQNNKELQRQASYSYPNQGQDHDRRGPMMEFGSANGGLACFQFGAPSSSVSDHGQSRRHSNADHMEMTSDYQSMNMNGGQPAFSTNMQSAHGLPLSASNVFDNMPADMMSNMMGYSNVGMSDLSSPNTPLDMFSANSFSGPFSPVVQGMPGADYGMNVNRMDEHQNSGVTDSANPRLSDPEHAAMMNSISKTPSAKTADLQRSNADASQGMENFPDPAGPALNQNLANDDSGYGSALSGNAGDAQPAPKPETKPNFSNIYSSSGFDMLGALMRVATRKNPEISIGAVDMSCAFVVCDVTQNDCPIIYVSDIFERLTGYNKHEVLGRNCRFLQSPDGKVVSGIKRKYVDDDSVYYLKTRITQRKEAQRSLINYRKGGQPFMNLLTTIPITWDSDEIKYIVGFQVDLVEQPGSVAGKGQGGSYTVNYSQGMLPRYVWQPPPEASRQQDGGQTISRDDVSAVLSSFSNSTESELTKRMWDKVLLENTDDVVHVLSLKGLFLYLSPSSRQVLEYDASELVGTALSSVCHPSDIVPVTRELKDTSAGTSVNVVYRIRRKKSGYTWFESHGSLCVEQGKGRKCIILVGRERPVYALARQEIEAAGGIGDSELWTKLSTSGMFLFVSSNIRTLLDRQPDELVGTSIQSIMRADSKVEFGRTLEKARTGKRVVFKHEVINKRGLQLQATTTLYPGDATEGTKPTFLVAQTRLIKASSRAVAPALTTRDSSRSINSTDSKALSITSKGAKIEPGSTVINNHPNDNVVTVAGGGGLLIGSQDLALASDDNVFDELKTTRCTSWQFELRQMEKSNRLLSEELASLLQNRKKRKRRKGAGNFQRDCANCHTHTTPEWRRGPSGQRDLCNSCGLRWAKQVRLG